VWALNKGLDLTDESCALLLLAEPPKYSYITSYHLIVSRLPRLLGNEVCNYRLFLLISRVFAATLLAGAICAWCRLRVSGFNDEKSACFWVLSVTANMVAYAFLPPAFTYNALTSFLLLSATALIFYGNARLAPDFDAQEKLCLIGAGAFAGLCFFAKPTSTAAFFVLVFSLAPKRRWSSSILCMLLGAAVGVAVYFTAFDNPLLWLNRSSILLENAWRDGVHSPVQLLRDYCLDGVRNLSRAAIAIGPMVLSYWLCKRRRFKVYARVGALISVVVSIIYMTISHYFLKANLYYVVGVLSLITMMRYLAMKGVSPPQRNSFYRTLLFLALLPFALSCGTDTNLFEHAASNIAPWVMMVSICTACCKQWPVAFNASSIAISMFSIWLFFYGYLWHPYRLLAPLFRQDVKAEAGTVLAGLYLDQQTAHLIERLQITLTQAGFCKGDPIIALYEMPGLVYAAGGRSVGIPWFRYVTQNIACAGISRLSEEHAPRIFLLLAGDKAPDITAKISQTLARQGAPYPQAFDSCGLIEDSDRRWWDLSKIYVFASKRASKNSKD